MRIQIPENLIETTLMKRTMSLRKRMIFGTTRKGIIIRGMRDHPENLIVMRITRTMIVGTDLVVRALGIEIVMTTVEPINHETITEEAKTIGLVEMVTEMENQDDLINRVMIMKLLVGNRIKSRMRIRRGIRNRKKIRG